MREQTIVVLGRFDAGKTTFIKSVSNAATALEGPRAAEEAPTQGIVVYDVALPGGQSLTFLDTPGFDGYQAGGERAKETEEILQMLEEHLAANGSRPVSHVLVFLNANDMAAIEFKGRARRTFERLFPDAQVVCVTTRWDQIEGEDGFPVTAEEAETKEERLYNSGRTEGSLLEYLDGGRSNGRGVLHFRCGLPTEAYSYPQDIVQKLLAVPGSDATLEERLAEVTKERDDLAARYSLLLQERQAPTAVGDAAPGPPHEAPLRAPRTRRQRLLATIDNFSARVFELVTELDREALGVADECVVNRAEAEAASAAIKVAEGKFAETTEGMKAAEEERSLLERERDTLIELERCLSMQLSRTETTAGQRSLNSGALASGRQRIDSRLKQTQTSLKDMEGWISTAEDYCQNGSREVERAAAEIKKWERIKQGKDTELKEWLSPESERLPKERENFRTLHESLSTNLKAMREGLNDSWEGKLGDNCVFLEHLGGYAVDSEMVAHPGDWAPIVESFYESQVTLAVTQGMVKFHSAVLQQLKAQEDTAQREWKKRLEDIFEQGGPGLEESPLATVPQELPPPPPPLMGHSHSVNSVAFSWDGKKIVSGSEDNTVRVWDALTGEVQTVFEGHEAPVMAVSFSPDGKLIVSGSADKTARVWDVLVGRERRVLEGHSNWVWSVQFSVDGSRIISGSSDGSVRIWDALTSEVQRVLQGASPIYSVASSGDGLRLFSGSQNGSLRIWEASTWEERPVLKAHSDCVMSVASSGDGSQFVSGSWDRTVRVWDALTGKVLRVWEGHKDHVWSTSFSQDGSRICSGSADKTLRVWDASTGAVESVLEGHSDTVRAVAFSRDGSRIVSGSNDKTIRVWSMPPSTSSSHGT